MSLLNPDGISEENAGAIADIPSYIVVSLFSVIFCGFISLSSLFSFSGYIRLIEIFFVLFFPAIVGITATFYAVRTLIAKKNLDYENTVICSQFAKIWTIAAYILGILSWLAQFAG